MYSSANVEGNRPDDALKLCDTFGVVAVNEPTGCPASRCGVWSSIVPDDEILRRAYYLWSDVRACSSGPSVFVSVVGEGH